MAQCYRCGTAIPQEKTIYRNSECDSCGADLKVCLNCRFYDPGAHWECRETIPEAVREKDRANFCEFFQPVRSGAPAPGSSSGKAQKSTDAADQLRKLFGDS